MATRTYSSRLGAIDDAQLAAAVARHGLGQFLRAAPIAGGLFGQNLFLHTTAGEFVLRGAPHWVDGAPNDAWQFGKEAFFAERLHAHTDVPSPWPQWRDRDDDLFGWPYVIMRRLRGLCLHDRAIAPRATHPEAALPSRADRQGIARALGIGLARLQRLRSPVAGDVDVRGEFAAWPRGHAGYLADDLLQMADAATANGAFGARERAWLVDAIAAGTAGGARQPGAVGAVFVHADYKLDNLVLVRTPRGHDPRGAHAAVGEADEAWSVCGVFDLHTACFGLPLLDLCRTACTWLDLEPAFARTFVQAWQAASGTPVIDAATLRLCLLNERMKIWEYFTRPEQRAAFAAQVPHATDFVRFVEPYLAGMREIAAPSATPAEAPTGA